MSSRKIATVVILAIIPVAPVMIAATTLTAAHPTVVSVSADASTPTPQTSPDDTPWG